MKLEDWKIGGNWCSRGRTQISLWYIKKVSSTSENKKEDACWALRTPCETAAVLQCLPGLQLHTSPQQLLFVFMKVTPSGCHATRAGQKDKELGVSIDSNWKKMRSFYLHKDWNLFKHRNKQSWMFVFTARICCIALRSKCSTPEHINDRQLELFDLWIQTTLLPYLCVITFAVGLCSAPNWMTV